MIKSYSEVMTFQTFEERYNYLRIGGSIGIATFGSSRFMNQAFYISKEWKDVRNFVIVRDNACDLAISDRELLSGIKVHHINPLTVKDIEEGTKFLFDPEYLICTSGVTHNAIHFGYCHSTIELPKARYTGDTKLWGF